MKRLLLSICILLSGLASSITAGDAGTQSPFSMGTGARELALGGANLATVDATTAPYWNASRLADAQHLSMSGFHSNLYDSDVSYQYLGVVIPTLDFGSLGFGVFRLGVDGIEKRDNQNLLMGEIDDSRLAFYVAYGRTISGYDVGLATSIEHHSLDEYSASASPGLDFSISRRLTPGLGMIHGVTFALNIRNVLQPTVELAEQKYTYPLGIDLGMSVELLPGYARDHSAVLSSGMRGADQASTDFSAGLEYSFHDMLILRGGMRGDNMAVGAGIAYRQFRFDYAMVDRDMGSINMFTLTTDFGLSMSDRRLKREQQRETDFNDLMRQRLVDQNSELIGDLVSRGRSLLHQDSILEASDHFERALFLARANNLDTVMVANLARETNRQLVAIESEYRHDQYIDSATTSLDAGEYLAARYFAGLALAQIPESFEAGRLLRVADDAIERSAARDDMIAVRIREVDSLLNYGKVTQARSVVTALQDLAPNNEALALLTTRVEFEHWRQIALSAYDRKDYSRALVALDSTGTLLPGHQWTEELRRRIASDRRTQANSAVVSTPPKSVELSPQLRKDVEAAYGTAQQEFQQGNLDEAILHWERVEQLAPDYASVREYLVNAYKFVGVEMYGQNRLEEAVREWNKAATLAPNNEEIATYIKRTENEIVKLRELSYDQ